MPFKPRDSGHLHLFRVAGIDVFLHWTWFLIAIAQIATRAGRYNSYIWCVWEYLALFGIVLMHEFGHALACRSVGGQADRIILWPLGGVAYVAPPPRPGATLWSLAAGPLVNFILFPILVCCCLLIRGTNLSASMPDFYHFVYYLTIINLVLLCFNMLPIYPLDGGQILRCLLWFVAGRARSLTIASAIGLLAVPSLVVLGITYHFGSTWLCAIGIYAMIRSWNGFKEAQILARMEKAPRHEGLACPSCRQAPLAGNFWLCTQCRQAFDMFNTQGVCPHCGVGYDRARCLDCSQDHPFQEFSRVQWPASGWAIKS